MALIGQMIMRDQHREEMLYVVAFLVVLIMREGCDNSHFVGDVVLRKGTEDAT